MRDLPAVGRVWPVVGGAQLWVGQHIRLKSMKVCPKIVMILVMRSLQVDPPAGGHGDLHMTLHLSDMQAQRSVVSTRDWTGGQLDVGGLSPWSSHQYSLQLEDQFGHKGRHYACEYCRTLEEGEGWEWRVRGRSGGSGVGGRG